jgi:hypothetical protein
MTLYDCESLEEAEFLAGAVNIVTAEQRRHQHTLQRRLAVAEADERAMEAWHQAFPQDVRDKQNLYTQNKAEHIAEKEGVPRARPSSRHRGKPQTISDNRISLKFVNLKRRVVYIWRYYRPSPYNESYIVDKKL